ncbi:hypothetical protein KI387_015592, partial [Taxus chinensis]
TDDVGIPILEAIYEDIVEDEALEEVGGMTNIEGAIYADGAADVEGAVGDVDTGV